jgi:hypothetical protein
MFSIDFVGDMTSSAGIQIDDRDFGSLFDEELADVFADISASPGNDSDLVLESHIVLQINSFPLHSRCRVKLPDREDAALHTHATCNTVRDATSRAWRSNDSMRARVEIVKSLKLLGKLRG